MCMEKPKAPEPKKQAYPYKRVVRLNRKCSRVTLKPHEEHLMVCCMCGYAHNVAVNREVEMAFSANSYESLKEMKKLLDTERKRSK